MGCGFTPLYMDDKGGYSVSSEFGMIDIALPKNRNEQLMRHALMQNIVPKGNALYRLSFQIHESHSDLIIESDAVVTRENYTMTVHYKLVDIKTSEVIIDNKSHISSSYDVSTSSVVNEISRKATILRSIQALARDIATQLAVTLRVYHVKKDMNYEAQSP